jgi:hypothetical protein
MSNDNNKFLDKFKNRIENIGKDGINGLIKNTVNSTPIDKNYYNTSKQQQKKRNKNINNIQNEYFNNQKKFVFQGLNNANNPYNYENNQNFYNNNYYNYNQNNNNHYPSKFDEYQATNNIQQQLMMENIKNNIHDINLNAPMNHSQIYHKNHYISNNNTNNNVNYLSHYNNNNTFNNNNFNNQNNGGDYNDNIFNNITPAGYKPYTLKEYKEMNKPVVLGKLGPNIGTKSWKEKKEKMDRLKNYSNIVNKKKVGLNSFKQETIEEELNKIHKNKMEESKNFRSKTYGNILRTNTFNYKKMEDIINKENNYDNNIRKIKTNQFLSNRNNNLEILNEEKEEYEDNNNLQNYYNNNNKNNKNFFSYELNKIKSSLIN